MDQWGQDKEVMGRMIWHGRDHWEWTHYEVVEFNFQMWTLCVNVMESWGDWWVILYAVPVILMVGRLSDLGVEIACLISVSMSTE